MNPAELCCLRSPRRPAMSQGSKPFKHSSRFVNALTLCLVPLVSAAQQLVSVAGKQRAVGVSPRVIADRVASRVTRVQDLPSNYMSDLQLEALLALGDATNDGSYLTFVQEVMARRQTPPAYRHSWKNELYTSISFDLLVRSGDAAYRKPFVDESVAYRNEVLRAFDGTVSVYVGDHYDHMSAPIVTTAAGSTYVKREWTPVLVDQVQEYASRMAKVGCLTGDGALFKEAASQIRLMRVALRDTNTGLWSHARGFVDSASSLTETKWGRGQAWALRGLIEALTYLPAGSPEASQVKEILEEFSRTLIRYQDSDGFWRQVVDRPDSYQETSATGLISYYFSRAVNQGLLPEDPYGGSARKAYEAIATRSISSEGDVLGGCKSTPPLPSTRDYMERAAPANDGHAIAAAIFAAVGQILLEKASGAYKEQVVAPWVDVCVQVRP
jgi:rhamnogalacturonyl hydrolase YesR